jgi:hypothetical protein
MYIKIYIGGDSMETDQELLARLSQALKQPGVISGLKPPVGKCTACCEVAGGGGTGG